MTTLSLEEFHHDLRQDILAGSEARQDFLEIEFATVMARELEDSGVIEGFESCHYRAVKGMRVDGYWFREDEAALDLFIIDFNNRVTVESLTSTSVTSIFKRLENFFKSSVSKKLYENLDETSQAYGLSREISDRKNSFSKVNFYLISENILSERLQVIEEQPYEQWQFSYHVWDLSRFHRLTTSKGHKEDLIVDFREFADGGIQCLPAHLKTADYQSYLLVMPADILANLYGKYGGRLLEQNVRSFLQARGKVNKGIRVTIMNDPDMFFAYNNGITATAKEVITENRKDGIYIQKIRDFQIVNGGQTTASLFHTNRKDKVDLGEIFIQVKLSVIDEERSEEVVPKISEYANTQNKVNAADFFSNHPFHIRMEEFSRKMWAPPKDGEVRETKWFYERARGQYLDAQASLSKAEKKKFLSEYPKPQMFNKTDLAKFANPWEFKPHIVSRGAQKNFADYAREIGGKWEKNAKQFNELYFKHMIAKAIIFRTTEKLVSNQSWYDGGYRANIVVYTLALIASKISKMKKALNFTRIWEEQKISEAFYNQIKDIAKEVNSSIINTPAGISNVTEWAKKDGCWLSVQNIVAELNDDFIVELIDQDSLKAEEKDAKRVQRIDDGIEAQSRVINLGPAKWREIMEWGMKNKLLTKDDISFIKVATRISARIPSEKQCVRLIGILMRLQEEGYVI